MRIRNFLKESYNDYAGKVSAVVFSPGCDYNCPACHVKHLLNPGEDKEEKEFFDYLDSRKEWIQGVVLCGGEPTLQPDLAGFVKKLKQRGLAVKLDTNGNHPQVLKKLYEEDLIDYIAMDVKAPKELYETITGVSGINLQNIEESLQIVSEFPAYEFRTTISPIIRKEIDFMTPKEVGDIAKWIVEVTGDSAHRYYLQPFVPRQGELIDPRLEEFPETPKDLMEKAHREAIKYLSNCKIR